MERCQRCHRLYETVWDTSDQLWEQVTGYSEGQGLRCPECFDTMARLQGLDLYWECAVGHFPSLKLAGPTCPDCGEVMVKAHVQWEDGSWTTFWSCGCVTPEDIKAEGGNPPRASKEERC